MIPNNNMYNEDGLLNNYSLDLFCLKTKTLNKNKKYHKTEFLNSIGKKINLNKKLKK